MLTIRKPDLSWTSPRTRYDTLHVFGLITRVACSRPRLSPQCRVLRSQLSDSQSNADDLAQKLLQRGEAIRALKQKIDRQTEKQSNSEAAPSPTDKEGRRYAPYPTPSTSAAASVRIIDAAAALSACLLTLSAIGSIQESVFAVASTDWFRSPAC